MVVTVPGVVSRESMVALRLNQLQGVSPDPTCEVAEEYLTSEKVTLARDPPRTLLGSSS
jgi:hypothetical protein